MHLYFYGWIYSYIFITTSNDEKCIFYWMKGKEYTFLCREEKHFQFSSEKALDRSTRVWWSTALRIMLSFLEIRMVSQFSARITGILPIGVYIGSCAYFRDFTNIYHNTRTPTHLLGQSRGIKERVWNRIQQQGIEHHSLTLPFSH